MKEAKLSAAVEIGTSHTAIMVGEWIGNDKLRIIARHAAYSSGVRKSCIYDVNQAAYALQKVMQMLSEQSKLQIIRTGLVVTGPDIVAKKFTQELVLDGKEVAEKEVEQLDREGFAFETKQVANGLIDSQVAGFDVDGACAITTPLGIRCNKLSAHTLLMLDNPMHIANLKAVTDKVNLEVTQVSYSGLCAAEAVLTDDQKKAGALVIDLGAGTTSCLVYAEGVVAHGFVVPLGGDHITNDIRHAFALSRGDAITLKHEAAAAILRAEGNVEVDSHTPGFDKKCISRKALDVVVYARMREIFALILSEMEKSNLLYHISHVYVTGGGAKLAGVCELGSRILGKPCEVGKLVPDIEGLEDEADSFAWATLAGQLLRDEESDKDTSTLKSVTGFMKRMFT